MTLSELLDNEDFRAGRMHGEAWLLRFRWDNYYGLEARNSLMGSWIPAKIERHALNADWRLVEPEKE